MFAKIASSHTVKQSKIVNTRLKTYIVLKPSKSNLPLLLVLSLPENMSAESFLKVC